MTGSLQMEKYYVTFLTSNSTLSKLLTGHDITLFITEFYAKAEIILNAL